MIVPMKKISVIVQKKDIDSALGQLRELGSVHVLHHEDLKGDELAQLREEVNQAVHVDDSLKQVRIVAKKEKKSVVQEPLSGGKEKICTGVPLNHLKS